MSGPVSTAARHLIAAGVTGDALVTALEEIESSMKKQPTPGALRQRRYRERKQSVTSDVTVTEQKKGPPDPLKENITTYGPNGPTVAADAADFRQMLFTEGRESLQRQTGKRDAAARSLLGKWLKSANDDAKKVLEAILCAERERVADVVAWVTRCLGPPDNHNTRMLKAFSRLAGNDTENSSTHGTLHRIPGSG